MLKDRILILIKESNFPICDDCVAENQKFSRQQSHRCCSQLLREDFIFKEKTKCNFCNKSKKSSIITENGIEYLDYLNKKGMISESIELVNSGQFNIDFKYEWLPIFIDQNTKYTFPLLIDRTNKSLHNIPAVYRWVMINVNGEKTQNIYVGEAAELARRVYHYVKPGGTQQTNIRLNELFYELKNLGYSITIEQLKFEPFEIGGHTISVQSLKNKLVRRFLEHLMASFYTLEGYNVINA